MSKKTKRILIIAVCVLVVAAVITGLVLWRSAVRRERTTIVGFYEVPAAYQAAVQEVIERSFTAGFPEGVVLTGEAATDKAAEKNAGKDAPLLQFVVLTDEEAATSSLTKKVDVLITQTGALTTSLMTKAVAGSTEIAGRFPRTTQKSPYFTFNGKLVVMPLFLDHLETSYFTILQKSLGAATPSSLAELAEYAEWAKEEITYPIIASGADDTVLFSFVSALVESVTGSEGYRQLVKGLSEISNKGLPLDEALSLPLQGNAPYGLTFDDILGVFRDWRASGLMLGDWYETQEATVRVYMEDLHAGIVEMLLSQRRRMPYPMIKSFEGTQFPADTSVSRALIAPSVSLMNFRESDVTAAFADALSSADEQEFLSMKTQLAPTTLRGQSFDIQADDVRFMAATSEGGPVPDLGHAAFATAEKRAEFAAWLRDQLR